MNHFLSYLGPGLFFPSYVQLVSCSLRSCQRVGKRNKNWNRSIWFFDSSLNERFMGRGCWHWIKLEFCLLIRKLQEPTDGLDILVMAATSIFLTEEMPSSTWKVACLPEWHMLTFEQVRGQSYQPKQLASSGLADVSMRWLLHQQSPKAIITLLSLSH